LALADPGGQAASVVLAVLAASVVLAVPAASGDQAGSVAQAVPEGSAVQAGLAGQVGLAAQAGPAAGKPPIVRRGVLAVALARRRGPPTVLVGGRTSAGREARRWAV